MRQLAQNLGSNDENPIRIQQNRYDSVLKFQRKNISILQQAPVSKHVAIKSIEKKKVLLQKQHAQLRQRGWDSQNQANLLPKDLSDDIERKLVENDHNYQSNLMAVSGD